MLVANLEFTSLPKGPNSFHKRPSKLATNVDSSSDACAFRKPGCDGAHIITYKPLHYLLNRRWRSARLRMGPARFRPLKQGLELTGGPPHDLTGPVAEFEQARNQPEFLYILITVSPADFPIRLGAGNP